MEWLLWACVVVVLGLAAVAGSGRLGAMPPPVHDVPRPELPEGALDADDLRGVQFAVVTRGYSMAQVDELLDRLASQLEGANGPGDQPAGSLPAHPSAIMDAGEFSQQRREGEHGSNEAPHG